MKTLDYMEAEFISGGWQGPTLHELQYELDRENERRWREFLNSLPQP